MSRNRTRRFEIVRSGILIASLACAAGGVAQESVKPAEPPQADGALTDSVRELREQVRELQEAVALMRADWQQSRAETTKLRRQLEEARSDPQMRNAVLHPAAATSSNISSALNAGTVEEARQGSLTLDEKSDQEQGQQKDGRTPSLEEEYQLLSGKVDDQYQTKVESASKYRLRLSGIVLMNLVSNQGVVNSIDLPTLASPRLAGDSGGSFGATLRQSEIGLEAFGPTVAGAKTRADLQLDLAGGFSSVPNGINSGLVRLRTGTLRMDWTNTSIVVGQDNIFFSPNSPTSFASLAIPALSYAGNLWSWAPQVRVEHRVILGDESSLLFQGGILDPVSGEYPAILPGTSGTGYYRHAGPGEASRQPALATRMAWTHNVLGQPLRLGAGGYYSRQDYGFDRTIDGWAAMTDIDLPLTHQFSLSGEVYRGKGMGGLYAAGGRSALFSGDLSLESTEVKGLNSVGGWAQLKYRPANKLEFNAAFGLDNPYADDLRYFPYSQSYGDPTLARNRGSFVNMIYRPRSDLLFSGEYRYLTTYSTTGAGNNAGQLNLMMGVLF